jgi:large subunit ribosomal protein L21
MTDETKDTAPAETSAPSEPTPAEPVAAAPATPAPEPQKYAVIETGGKQYRVKVGDTITVERLAVDAGSDVSLDRVLLIGGDGSTRIGTPVVEGASVSATVNDHGRGEKIVVFKFKAKKRYRRRTGHRQAQTYLTITGIAG